MPASLGVTGCLAVRPCSRRDRKRASFARCMRIQAVAEMHAAQKLSDAKLGDALRDQFPILHQSVYGRCGYFISYSREEGRLNLSNIYIYITRSPQSSNIKVPDRSQKEHNKNIASCIFGMRSVIYQRDACSHVSQAGL